jgi:putative sterol carrier protein
VSVKFLSPEWAASLKVELNGSDAFRQAAAGKTARLQQVISTAEGNTHYWIVIDDGTIDMGIGDIEAPDASYDTAVGMARREVSPVTAFMMGKVKVAGSMGMLLGLQNVLTQLPDAMARIDVEY